MVDDAPATVALALGSNLGDRLENMRAAMRDIRQCVAITARSDVYETPAAYVADQPAFLNAALIGTTAVEPQSLLRFLKNAESAIGREPTFRYGPRVIDIDLLFYGDRILDLPDLTVPHPRLAERDFVLRPLCDIAPQWRHPQNGLTVTEMLAALSGAGMVSLGQKL